jgi:hypothetical protein
MAPSQPSLPTNRVFVVQFRLPPTEAPAGYDGRGEHLVSGQATRFHSLEGLLAFMIRVLADVQHQAKPREPARGSSGAGTRVETVIMTAGC